MIVKEFYDNHTFTLTYVVYDKDTKDAVVIDPVLGYEPQASKLFEEPFDLVKDFIKEQGLNLHYVLETHAHADHLTSAQKMKEAFPHVKTAIHENICLVQEIFKGVFNFDDTFDVKGKAFDVLLKDEQVVEVGSLKIKVIHTPGHTPACVSFYINEQVLFTGDALFMPDFGTGRCDFPKGSAKDLYDSIQNKIYTLPNNTEVYVGHDYQPGGRSLEFKATIAEEKENNIQLKASTKEADFIEFREARDKTLKAPKLLLASIQVNAQNGQIPEPESNGTSYIKLPIR